MHFSTALVAAFAAGSVASKNPINDLLNKVPANLQRVNLGNIPKRQVSYGNGEKPAAYGDSHNDEHKNTHPANYYPVETSSYVLPLPKSTYVAPSPSKTTYPAAYGSHEEKPVYHENKPVYHVGPPAQATYPATYGSHEDKSVYPIDPPAKATYGAHEDKPSYPVAPPAKAAYPPTYGAQEGKPSYSAEPPAKATYLPTYGGHEDKPVYPEHEANNTYPAQVYPVAPKSTYTVTHTVSQYYPAAPAKPTYSAPPYNGGDKPAYDSPAAYYNNARDAAASGPAAVNKGFVKPAPAAADAIKAKPVKNIAKADPTAVDAVAADAAPNSSVNDMCGNGNAVSCCNTMSKGKLLNLILGGSCSLQVPILAAALGNGCNAGNTFCCPTNQNGSINIALPCIPLNL